MRTRMCAWEHVCVCMGTHSYVHGNICVCMGMCLRARECMGTHARVHGNVPVSRGTRVCECTRVHRSTCVSAGEHTCAREHMPACTGTRVCMGTHMWAQEHARAWERVPVCAGWGALRGSRWPRRAHAWLWCGRPGAGRGPGAGGAGDPHSRPCLPPFLIRRLIKPRGWRSNLPLSPLAIKLRVQRKAFYSR